MSGAPRYRASRAARAIAARDAPEPSTPTTTAFAPGAPPSVPGWLPSGGLAAAPGPAGCDMTPLLLSTRHVPSPSPLRMRLRLPRTNVAKRTRRVARGVRGLLERVDERQPANGSLVHDRR